jgi:uncharacterized membrane protein YeiH
MFDMIPVLDSTRTFQVPFWLDAAALFLFAISGALKAAERGYDYIGGITLAFVTGAVGGLLRDIFLGVRPAVLQDARYLVALTAGAAVGILFGRIIRRLWTLYDIADALGLAIYCVVGSLKGIHAGLPFPSSVLLGAINGAGGSILRDLLVGEQPLILKPGQHYFGIALAGGALFCGLVLYAGLPSAFAGIVAIFLAFVLRLLVIRYDWRTAPIRPLDLRFPAVSPSSETNTAPETVQEESP